MVEFTAVCEAYDRKQRGSWERVRTLATLLLQPWSRKKIAPRDVLSFGWDTTEPPRGSLSGGERRKRMEAMRKKWG